MSFSSPIFGKTGLFFRELKDKKQKVHQEPVAGVIMDRVSVLTNFPDIGDIPVDYYLVMAENGRIDKFLCGDLSEILQIQIMEETK